MPEIGRLRVVDIREVWPHEERDFSPWLAQNLDLIGAELGMSLTLVATEYGVGRFSLDILARDDDDRNVIIENQLEATDHDHLGKLVTYAAGADSEAQVIIWIARRFLDEHRAALDWLNRTTDVGRNFFGIELDAVRIGDSPAAPRLKIVVKPNDWQRAMTRPHAQASGESTFFYSFFEKLRDALSATGRYPSVKNPAAGYWWIPFRIKGQVYYSFAWSWDRFTLGLYVAEPNRAFNTEVFRELEARRVEIEARFGAPLEWDYNECRSRQQIWTALKGVGDRQAPETIDRVVKWSVEMLGPFVDATMDLARRAIVDVEQRQTAAGLSPPHPQGEDGVLAAEPEGGS